MDVISGANVSRGDLIARLHRRDADLASIGRLTDPVARRVHGDVVNLELRLQELRQPTVGEMRAAAHGRATEADSSATSREWGAIGTAVLASIAVGGAVFAPAALGTAMVVGAVGAVAWAASRVATGMCRSLDAHETADALGAWEAAYDQAAREDGAFPPGEAIPYHLARG